MNRKVKCVSGLLVTVLLAVSSPVSAFVDVVPFTQVVKGVQSGGRCRHADVAVVSNSTQYKCVKVDKKPTLTTEPVSPITEAPLVTVPPASPLAAWVDEVIVIVNKERTSVGLGSLGKCAALEQSALSHSQDMRDRDFFAHTNPDGQAPSDRIRRTGYFGQVKSRWTGENIAAGFVDAVSVMAAWMKSPPHRANVLYPKFTRVGVGIANVRSDSIYSGYIWTLNFGEDGVC